MAKVQFQFPMQGKDENWAVSQQPNLTSFDLLNVRPYDVIENRVRGGQRPGLDKWGNGDQIGGDTSPIVAICSVTYLEYD
jgi:hypothetical protein